MSQKRKRKSPKKFPKVGRKSLKNEFELRTYKAIKNGMKPRSHVEYETEKLGYSIYAEYVPDFILTKGDGSKVYIETKGNGRSWTPDVMRKMIAVRDQHPDKDIRILFYSDGTMGRARKDGTFRRQSDWAKANNFKFAIRDIPEEWFE